MKPCVHERPCVSSLPMMIGSATSRSFAQYWYGWFTPAA